MTVTMTLIAVTFSMLMGIEKMFEAALTIHD
jgi:hypothetical protein